MLNLSHLTRPAHCGDTGRSLKSTSSTPALCCEAGFFVPSFRPHAPACMARSLGVSGSRKAPDALVRVESTPTPFRVVINLASTRRLYA
jgi:hypothetical protein